MWFYSVVSFRNADGGISLTHVYDRLGNCDKVEDRLTYLLTDFVKRNIITIQVTFSHSPLLRFH